MNSSYECGSFFKKAFFLFYIHKKKKSNFLDKITFFNFTQTNLILFNKILLFLLHKNRSNFSLQNQFFYSQKTDLNFLIKEDTSTRKIYLK